MSPSGSRSGLSGGSAQSTPPHYIVLFRKFARWRRPGCPNDREPHPINRMPRVPRRLRGTRATRRTHEVTTTRRAVHPAERRFTPSAQIYRNRRTDAASSPAVDGIAFRSVGSACLACFASTVSPLAPYALPAPTIPVTRALRMPRLLHLSACPARSACLVRPMHPRVLRAPHALPIPSIPRTPHSSVEKSPYLLTFRPCGRKTALYARPKAHRGELRRLSIKGEQVF